MSHINWRRGDTPCSRRVRCPPSAFDTPASNHALKREAARLHRRRAGRVLRRVVEDFDAAVAFPPTGQTIKWDYW